MHPALSVILFTTLSGAGYGVLFWCALAAMAGGVSARTLLHAALAALAMVTLGLMSSLAHLGKPTRAWRAFSQWRTSWLSREGVAAVATYVPALLFCALLLPAMIGPRASGQSVALGAAGVVACLALMSGALLTVYCTAMIYASLTPIPAWRHRLVPMAYLLFSLFTGGLLLAATAAVSGAAVCHMAGLAVAGGGAALALLKLRYWRDIDRDPLPATRGAAVGLPARTIEVFERPHTEANYLTREMAFVVARRHSRWLRRLALALFALVPLLCMLPAWGFAHLDPAPWFAVAAFAALAGAFVERWLFFAEARHLVTLYY